jgi:hypothetical protein
MLFAIKPASGNKCFQREKLKTNCVQRTGQARKGNVARLQSQRGPNLM